jgi:hypothetical protein
MTAGPVTDPVLVVFCDRIYVCGFQALPLLLCGCESCFAYIKAILYIAGVWEQSIEESILIQESGSNRKMERNCLYVVSQLYFTPVIITIIRMRFIGCAGMGRNYNV